MCRRPKRLHRLVVRTSRRGRDNPGSTPGVDTCYRHRFFSATSGFFDLIFGPPCR